MDVFGNSTETVELGTQAKEIERRIKELKEEDWSEKYRPHVVDDILLPSATKDLIKNTLKAGVQNMTFYSNSPGTGKTTTSIVIPESMGCQYKQINASAKGRLATVNDEITNYAMQKGLDGRPKIVLLDEVDGVTSDAFFDALRVVMDWSKDTLRFILTCNNISKVPDAILSRCTPISFNKTTDPSEEKALKNSIFKKLNDIAITETGDKSKVEKKTIIDLVNSYYPDVRKMIKSLQLNFIMNNGEIKGNIVAVNDTSVEGVWKLIQEGRWEDSRIFYNQNVSDHAGFYTKLLDYTLKTAPEQYRMSIASIVAEFQYRAASSQVNQELNMTCGMFSALVRLMKA